MEAGKMKAGEGKRRQMKAKEVKRGWMVK